MLLAVVARARRPPRGLPRQQAPLCPRRRGPPGCRRRTRPSPATKRGTTAAGKGFTARGVRLLVPSEQRAALPELTDAEVAAGGWKPCMYYAHWYCKNGSSCRFVHGPPDHLADQDMEVWTAAVRSELMRPPSPFRRRPEASTSCSSNISSSRATPRGDTTSDFLHPKIALLHTLHVLISLLFQGGGGGGGGHAA